VLCLEGYGHTGGLGVMPQQHLWQATAGTAGSDLECLLP